MKIKVTKENIESYRHVKNRLVTEIIWEAGPLDGEILANFPNLVIFDCSSNGLTTLAGLESCALLQILYCYYNELETLTGIENCTRLKNIDCYYNKLTTLLGIENCIQLRELNCSYNKLTTLIGLENCSQLQKFSCSSNKLTTLLGIENWVRLENLSCSSNELTTLTGIENCTQLQKLNCYNNNLTILAGIENCTQLQVLWCFHNKLTTLTGIENCIQLQKLDCSNNEIRKLDPIVYLRHLGRLNTDNNPLAIQTIQVQRFLQRIGRFNHSSSIYTDTQNVHNTTIQKSVCDSIKNLMRDPKPVFTIDTIIQSSIDNKVKEQLVEYCSDTTEHSIHLLTYFDLLSYVWSRVERSEHCAELFKILSEQIQDSECKCFTGRFNRTLSILVGFYDDITIEISDSDRISAIVIAIREKHSDLSPHEQRELARLALAENGYDEATIQPWIDAITEDIE